MLDVGAAAGFILQGFIDGGWKGCGIEPNQQMVNYGNQILGLSLEVGSLEDLVSSDRYDLISMIQVISHFYDLQKAPEDLFWVLFQKSTVI